MSKIFCIDHLFLDIDLLAAFFRIRIIIHLSSTPNHLINVFDMD